MNYISQLYKKDQTVFNIQDIRSIWNNVPSRRTKQYLQYHVKQENLNQVHRGVYTLPDREVNNFELGSKLRSPSYISFETVLYQAGVIFQWDDRIRLVSYESRQIEVLNKVFQFSQLKKEILLNPLGVIHYENYSMATTQRAFLDILYLDPNFYFDNVRSIDFESLYDLVNIYGRKSLIKVVKKWENYARSF